MPIHTRLDNRLYSVQMRAYLAANAPYIRDNSISGETKQILDVNSVKRFSHATDEIML